MIPEETVSSITILGNKLDVISHLGYVLQTA